MGSKGRDENLFYEASEGKDARLMKSLDHGASPNEANNWGQLPLHYASVRGNFKACAILLGRGSNVNHQDQQGNTTLHYAAKRNHASIVGLLRDYGADPEIKNAAGQTPYDLATGDRVKRILERMRAMTADPHNLQLIESIQKDNALNPADANGDTLMHQYVMQGKIKKLQKLLEKGADPTCANRSNGDTPLHLAVKQADAKLVTLLIESNAYINAQNNEGMTPLHYSCVYQKDVMLHLLLDYQADISILTKDGHIAMQLVKTKKGTRLLSQARSRCEPKTHKVIGDYILGQTLGTGSFAKVKVATHMKTKKKFAIKIVQKKTLEEEDKERLSREIHIMRLLHHPSIVEFHDHFESERNIYLVMELVNGVDLFDYIYLNDPIPEKTVKKIFTQMLEGLAFIHQFGIVHRDLKPENILVNLEDLEVKIIDFGLSNVQQKLIFDTACGSPHYVAPEVLMGRSYGPEVDIWSMGVILHVMLFGELPFDEDTVDITKTPNLESLLEFPPELGRSEEAKDIVRRMLVRQARKRIDLDHLRAHPWLGLPPYEMVELVDAADVRRQVLAQMKILGFDENTVVAALKQRHSSPATRIYSLLCRHQRARKKVERVSTVVVGGQNPLQHQRREEQRKIKESLSLGTGGGEGTKGEAEDDDEDEVDDSGESSDNLLEFRRLERVPSSGGEDSPAGVASPSSPKSRSHRSSDGGDDMGEDEKVRPGREGSSKDRRSQPKRDERRDSQRSSRDRRESDKDERRSGERHRERLRERPEDSKERRAHAPLPALPVGAGQPVSLQPADGSSHSWSSGQSRKSQRRSARDLPQFNSLPVPPGGGKSAPPVQPPPVPPRRDGVPAPQGPAPVPGAIAPPSHPPPSAPGFASASHTGAPPPVPTRKR